MRKQEEKKKLPHDLVLVTQNGDLLVGTTLCQQADTRSL